MKFHTLTALIAVSVVAGAMTGCSAKKTPAASDEKQSQERCSGLPSHADFRAALISAKAEKNGGFGNEMWGTVVNRDGAVCVVAFTGAERGDQWPGSRVISAAKAFTANAFSSAGFAVATANLYSAVQPTGPLFGLVETNPVDASVAYSGDPATFGQGNDPLVGRSIGGIVVFGGGVPLYDSSKKLVGALGVSGDTSCADHHIAWRTRNALKLDFVPAGESPEKSQPDNIVYDVSKSGGHPASKSGWGHPACSGDVAKIAKSLPATQK